MAAAAHTPGGFGGVPQKVGKEFNKADSGTGILKGRRPKRKPTKRARKGALGLGRGLLGLR